MLNAMYATPVCIAFALCLVCPNVAQMLMHLGFTGAPDEIELNGSAGTHDKKAES